MKTRKLIAKSNLRIFLKIKKKELNNGIDIAKNVILKLITNTSTFKYVETK